MLTPEQQEKIMAHADSVAPHECCGFVMEDGKIIKATNRHEDPENYFRISTQKFLATKKKGLIKAVYHSHVNGFNDFSGSDIAASRATGLPYILYFQPKPEFHYYDPNVILPYEGREYHFAYQNCYSLVCDYYKQELKIKLNDYYPDYDHDWGDLDDSKVEITDNERKYRILTPNSIKPEWQGFDVLPPQTEIRLHDILCMKIERTGSGLHLGVVTDVERAHMLHQLTDRLSEKTVYGGYYRDVTRCIFRHKTLL
jgi:proteasome lid subunit RPN8/RPN11